MFVMDGRFLALAVLVAAINPTKAFSDMVYSFENGGILEKHTKDDTAIFPADDASGIVGTITTLEVVNADGTDGGELNENSGSLGINSVGSEASASAFDGQESWTFSWDVDTTLDFIDFNAFTGSETMTIQSNDWKGKDYTIDANINFEKSAGQFTFGDDSTDDGADAFDLTEIISGDSLLVSADTPYTFANGSVRDEAKIGELTFSATADATAAPEPGSAVALLGLAGAVVGRRWQRKRNQKNQQATNPENI